MWNHALVPLGDRAVTIDLSDAAGDATRDLIRCLDARLRRSMPVGVTAIVPAMRTVTLHYDPLVTTLGALEHEIAQAFEMLVVTDAAARPTIVIPVCYGGESGPDLDDVAAVHGTTSRDIVDAHTAGMYTVAALGFLPGFAYLDGLPASLHTPRRAVPRTTVPAGSVGIGGSSTGVYPCRSPGGWHLIGRSPRALFDPARDPPSLLQPGDHVRFVAITPDELRIALQAA